MSEEKRGEQFHILRQVIEDREYERRRLFLQNIEDLAMVFESKLYEVEFDEWAGYLGQLEIFYSRSEVHKWIKIWQFFKEKKISLGDYLDIPVSRLLDIVKVGDIHLLNEAKSLLSRDWKDTIAECLGKPTTDTCKHNYTVYEICKTCGEKHRTKE